MSEFPLQGQALILTLAISALVWLGLQVLLFRSACDLCSVEPPGWLRAAVVVLIVSGFGFLLAAGMAFLIGLVGSSWGASKMVLMSMGALLSLPVQAVLAALLYKPLLHVALLKGMLIWALQRLLSVLLEAVFALVIVGGATLVEGIRRVL